MTVGHNQKREYLQASCEVINKVLVTLLEHLRILTRHLMLNGLYLLKIRQKSGKFLAEACLMRSDYNIKCSQYWPLDGPENDTTINYKN